MEWCLNCHRNPEHVCSAARRSLLDGIHDRRRTRSRARKKAREGVSHPEPHQLLNVPPVKRNKLATGSAGSADGCGSAEALWRSPEELSDSPEFGEFLHTEFPPNGTEFLDEASRRRFLSLMAGSLASPD